MYKKDKRRPHDNQQSYRAVCNCTTIAASIAHPSGLHGANLHRDFVRRLSKPKNNRIYFLKCRIYFKIIVFVDIDVFAQWENMSTFFCQCIENNHKFKNSFQNYIRNGKKACVPFIIFSGFKFPVYEY